MHLQVDQMDTPLKKAPKRVVKKTKSNKLTEGQVRINHVVSEQKRRELIRALYDELVEIVPDLLPKENRSEMVIYLKTANYLRWLYKRNAELRKQIDEKFQGEKEIPSDLVWNLREDE
ncbi:Protein INO4 [Nakaseomyces bracarensis]|uniref:Protein INO4 n=1 Tax=Nakaseomyces bracarensis TaxID=273131 RepID=A0ABR4NPD0_9SACH